MRHGLKTYGDCALPRPSKSSKESPDARFETLQARIKACDIRDRDAVIALFPAT